MLNNISYYSINDLAKLSGIKPHTIRIWEQRYHLICPERTLTNIRQYNDNELKKLLNVRLLIDSGFKISKIAKLSTQEIALAINKLHAKSEPNFAVEIDEFVACMIDLDEDRFNRNFNSLVLRIGFESTIVNVLFPFLKKIGILWGTNSIMVYQEHFICNLIRNRIIETAFNTKYAQCKKTIFILFLPPNEYHEIALLLSCYYLKINGFRVIYLGQNLPIESLSKVAAKYNNAFYLSIFTYPIDESFETYIKTAFSSKQNKKIIIAGNSSKNMDDKTNENVINIDSVNALKSYIEKIV